MSASEDIRLLQLDAIAECLDIVCAYAAHGLDHVRFHDEAGLQASLFRTAKSLNAAITTWREMRGDPASQLALADREGS